MLTQAIRNLRAMYLLPAVVAYQAFWQNVRSIPQRLSVFRKNPLVIWPSYLRGIYLLNKDGILEAAITGKTKVPPPVVGRITAVK